MQEALLKEQMERESLGRDLRANQQRLEEENFKLHSRYEHLETLIMSLHSSHQPTHPSHSPHRDGPSRYLDDIAEGGADRVCIEYLLTDHDTFLNQFMGPASPPPPSTP